MSADRVARISSSQRRRLTAGLYFRFRGINGPFRCHGKKRNPWNEIEGAEHNSRAMQSWNVLLALSGNSYDGPAGEIGFGPKLTPENFMSYFSAAELGAALVKLRLAASRERRSSSKGGNCA